MRQARRPERGLAVYRLAFGQPRQEDLVEYLRSRFSEEEIGRLLEDFNIDLSPIGAEGQFGLAREPTDG